jgi:CheY-like chemotaxis protein
LAIAQAALPPAARADSFKVLVVDDVGTAEAKLAIAQAALPPAARADSFKVLVVDDVPENRKLLLKIMAGSGFATRAASSGTEALAACAQQVPDLILMDTRMPELDGLETIRQLRAGPGGGRLKIITVSASAYEEDRLAAFQAGANDFVAKPVFAEELLGKARNLLGLKAAEPAGDGAAGLPVPVNRARAGRLPAELRQQLHEVIVYGDYEQVFQLLERVTELDPPLGARMTHMANELDSSGLLRLLTPEK